MYVYTLDSGFLKRKVIDDFESLIWTERYDKPGDFQLVTNATPAMIAELAEGTFVARPGTKEVMLIDTQSIEDNKLTVSGKSLLEFLNERWLHYNIVGAAFQTQTVMKGASPPGTLMGFIVDHWAKTPGAATGITADNIPNLSNGALDSSGSLPANTVIKYGQLLDVLKEIGDPFALGQSLYLDSASAGTYSLKYTVYKGIDHTIAANGIVQFSPALDSLAKIKELRSSVGYKTVAYGYANTEPSALNVYRSIIEAYPGAAAVSGFTRRVLLYFSSLTYKDIDAVDPTAPTPAEIAAFNATLDQQTRNALANNNYTKIVDGEVVPQSQFQYGVHYNLGDIVLLKGYTGISQPARITEYIRSQDETGERDYPSVSVIS